ncbi:MAG TPA: hypothetical protein VFK78_09340 [Gemmatimonadales bacterium]|nr:hypothetical protein [Gemmatimonadales bacterium]
MSVQKLSAGQLRKIDEIQEMLRTVAHVKTLVAELESNRAARAVIIENICSAIGREMSQMRQRTLTSPVGTVGDIAGALSVMAGRGGGINLKIRGLNDGVASLTMQLELALKVAMTPQAAKEAEKPKGPAAG